MLRYELYKGDHIEKVARLRPLKRAVRGSEIKEFSNENSCVAHKQNCNRARCSKEWHWHFRQNPNYILSNTIQCCPAFCFQSCSLLSFENAYHQETIINSSTVFPVDLFVCCLIFLHNPTLCYRMNKNI